MTKDKIRANILELCSESEYGSWEFWLKKSEDRTVEDAEQITQAIVDLVKEKKIYPMEYASVKDQTYKETELDVDRLKKQIISFLDFDNFVGADNCYWFLATEEGKKEDSLLRSKK